MRQINDAPVSWCKVEVAAQSPKSITRQLAEDITATASTDTTSTAGACASSPGGVEDSTPSKASPVKAAVRTGKVPPPPPVVTMSLSMKTVVSPRTHTHEVVALSVLIHREVRLDGASDEDGRKVRVF